jgi:hypothetical protein
VAKRRLKKLFACMNDITRRSRVAPAIAYPTEESNSVAIPASLAYLASPLGSEGWKQLA